MTSILFHRHTPWQSEIRCSTNIFASLFQQAGCDVSYMQGLVHAGNILAKKGQWQSWARGPRKDGGAWIYTPLCGVPFSRRWPFNTPLAVSLAYRTCVPSIRRQYRRSGFADPDVIWTANPGSSALKKIFPKAKLVFQVVDYYPAFSGSSIKKIETRDYQKADHIMVIGETLKNYIVNDHGIAASKITVLGQGVFNHGYQGDVPVPVELQGMSGPIAVWVGVIDKCDPAMFTAAAEELKRLGGNLVMIGPDAPWTESLKRDYDNVHLIGLRTPEEVPAYLLHSDIGLMLYNQDRQEIYKGQNPLKLYEYAAAGLPILSTQHDEYAFIDAPVITVTDQNEVAGAIQAAIENQQSMKQAALDFVAQRTWESIYTKARLKIDQLLSST